MGMIVTENITVENQINLFFNNFKLGDILRQSNIKKEKGVPIATLFQFILSIAFSGKNLYRLLDASATPKGIKKDVAYRLLNSLSANWRSFLLLLSTRVIVQKLLPLTKKTTKKVLIADDTLYSRNRSKKVELLARVFDHNSKLFVKGFRMLTLGWSDGHSFIPMLFSILSSAEEKNRLVPMHDGIDKRSNGYKRRKESICKSTDVLVDMVKLAIAAGTEASILLFDSWFAYPATIMRILALKMHVICMLKDTEKIHYTFEGHAVTLKQIYNSVRKRAGRAKILADAVVSIGNDSEGLPVLSKIVFIRHRCTKNWLAILSTDIILSNEEIVKLYRRRWDIEVFFKMCKSFLNLATEFQSLSFDAQVAHATLVCCRYIMLDIAKRSNSDPRTLGKLFHAVCDELSETSFVEALAVLLELLEETLQTVVGISKEQIGQLISIFIDKLTPVFKRRMLLLAPVAG